MSILNLAQLATIIGASATLLALFTVFVQLKHLRRANFILAWNAVKENLQNHDVRLGRAICRKLNAKNIFHSPRDSFPTGTMWDSIFRSLKHDFGNESWYRELSKMDLKRIRSKLESCVCEAYDAFDLAAILAWHSRIPGLWDTVVAEWEDGIIHTWEAGAPLLKRREISSRQELYECFSALYVTARLRQQLGRGLYPYTGAFRKLRLYRPLWWKAKQALRYRKLAMRSTRCDAPETH